jgi:hypothetical protein
MWTSAIWEFISWNRRERPEERTKRFKAKQEILEEATAMVNQC